MSQGSRDARRATSSAEREPSPSGRNKPGASTRSSAGAAGPPASSSEASREEQGHQLLERLEERAAALEASLLQQDFYAARSAADTIRALAPSLSGAEGNAELKERAERLRTRVAVSLPKAPPAAEGLGIDLVDPSADAEREAAWKRQLSSGKSGSETQAGAARESGSETASASASETASASRSHSGARSRARSAAAIASSSGASSSGASSSGASSSGASFSGAPYRWIPGTYQLLVLGDWISSAGDLTAEKDGRVSSISRSRELLRYLRSVGLLWWLSDAEVAAASSRITIPPPPGIDFYHVDVTVSVFNAVGLPPGSSASIFPRSDGSIEVIASAIDIPGLYNQEVVLSAAHLDHLFTALERFTGLSINAASRAELHRVDVRRYLGAGTVHHIVSRALAERWFGKEAYARWLAQRQATPPADAVKADEESGKADGGRPAAAPGPALFGEESLTSSLSPHEAAWARGWLAKNLPAAAASDDNNASSRFPILEPGVYEALQQIELHPRRARVLELLHQQAAERAPLSARLLERVLSEAQFEEEAALAGVPPEALLDGHAQQRRPIFDVPLRAALRHHSGLVMAGETVQLSIEIEWPEWMSSQQQSEVTWRRHSADCDWIFEKSGVSGPPQREHLHTAGPAPTAEHVFQLGPDEVSATWTVHAFVRHNFFRPAHLLLPLEVKSEAERLRQLRQSAFADLGTADVVEEEHDFSTSLFNEAFGADEYDEGALLRGEVNPELARLDHQARRRRIEQNLERYQLLLAYLRKDGRHLDAIAACEHSLAKWRDLLARLEEDRRQGWKPFEVRGSYLGRNNPVRDGALELMGAVRTTTLGEVSMVTVQLRDLSQRLEADDYCFEHTAETFEEALEQAFVALCKKYPEGHVSLLGEALDARGEPTGETLGYQLDTGSAWKDTKAVVWDPVATKVVNIGAAIVSVLLPMTAPVLIPAMIAYNASQTVDQMVDEWTSGRLTASGATMHLGSMLLDVLPLMHSARAVTASGLGFWVYEGVNWGGQAVLMTAQAQHAIAELRDRDVQELAEIYAAVTEREAAAGSGDAEVAQLRGKLDRVAQQLSQRGAEVVNQLVRDFAITTVPVQAVTHLRMIGHAAQLKALRDHGALRERAEVEPTFDERLGVIVGDVSKLDEAALAPLLAKQAQHLGALGDRLAEGLGVERERVHVELDAEQRVWVDGDRVEARYAPGTKADDAVAAWIAEARRARAAAEVEPAAPRQGGAPARRKKLHEEEHEAAVAERAEPEPAATVDQPALEQLVVAGHAVAGSSLRGRIRTQAKEGEIKAVGVHELPGAAGLTEGVRAVDRAAEADTYVLTFIEGAPISVRISAGPLDGSRPARTVVNPTKVGKSALAAPDAEPISVEGRYVIQLSDSLEPAQVQRALVHELSVIVVERALAKRHLAVRGDVLLAGEPPGAGAELSPRDRGRVAELEMLGAEVERAAAAQQEEKVRAGERELHALIEHLGLRQGSPGAVERRALVAPHLSEVAARQLARLAAPEAGLPPAVHQELMAVRERAAEDRAQLAAQAHYHRPLHETPIAERDGVRAARVSREEAVQLALRAEATRAAASKATLAKLRAEAAALPSGQHVVVDSPQLGGGAALAARDPARLLVDRRGRWQADASADIAQTASQLRGLVDAGVGDPFQFAGPNDRVPLAAVRYWEDSIAAQGPVIDGSAALELQPDGKTLLHIDPLDGSPRLTLQVKGTPLISSGFPPERIPGTPRNMSPDKAIDGISAHLAKLEGAAKDNPELRQRLSAARGELGTVVDGKLGRGPREPELARVREILRRHQLEELVSQGETADAHQMVLAGDRWHEMRTAAPDRVLLGDEANLKSLDPKAANKWVVAGSGGTGVSAAENIFAANDSAHVTLAGRDVPAGLLENDQLNGLVDRHADATTVEQVRSQTGADKQAGDGRMTMMFGVNAGIPQAEGGQFRISGEGPFKANDPMVGDGYIAAMGRDWQLPPMLAGVERQALSNKLRLEAEPIFDTDGRYVGYRVHIKERGEDEVLSSIDVTGAASRFLPERLLPPEIRVEMSERIWKAGLHDAPAEGGNFDGGFASSGAQASRYSRHRRKEEAEKKFLMGERQ